MLQVEYFSYNKMINEKFQSSQDTMGMLEGIMNEIFVRRADRIPPIPSGLFMVLLMIPLNAIFRSPTFKIPARVTLNDAKRQAWFADLANPDVPLHKLGKSVPHGAKGHDLLDLLHSNNVAIPRAIWFLRVFGANETVCYQITSFQHCKAEPCFLLGWSQKQTQLCTYAVQFGHGWPYHDLLA